MALLPFKQHFPPGPWCIRWTLLHSCATLSFSSPGKRGRCWEMLSETHLPIPCSVCCCFLGFTALICSMQHHEWSLWIGAPCLPSHPSTHMFLDVKNSKRGILSIQAPWHPMGQPTCSFRRETGQPWPCGPVRAYALPAGQCHPFLEQTSGAKGKHIYRCEIHAQFWSFSWTKQWFSHLNLLPFQSVWWPRCTYEISAAVTLSFLSLPHHIGISCICPATTLTLQQIC